MAFVERLGQGPGGAADRPGFIVNRVNRPFTLEALRILEAAAAASPRSTRRSRGGSQGPFELIDLPGSTSISRPRRSSATASGVRALRPSPIQEGLVEAGARPKAGPGFYRYAGESRIGEAGPRGAFEPDRSLAPTAIWPTGSDVEAIAEEARLAVAEGVAPPDTIDLALRLGAGHPRGPFEPRVRA